MQTGTATRDDAELLARLRAGEEAAFEELVRGEGPRLLRAAERLLGRGEDAADAVQEAFTSAFRSLDRFEGEARLSTWLHRIVVNAALMRLRTKRRRPETAVEDLLPKFDESGHPLERFAPWGEPADRAAQRAEVRDLVRASIEALPENYRNVLWMRDIEELEMKDIADTLGVTVNAAKIRLHRARQALRALLDPVLRAEGGVE